MAEPILDPNHWTEYYTGAQIRVYFGYLLIDEIASIEWAGTSSKRPVYGYASVEYDAVAKGQYLCRGAFIMPFKEVGYLMSVMDQLNGQVRGIEEIKRRLVARADGASVEATRLDGRYSPRSQVTTTSRAVPGEPSQTESRTIVSTMTPEDLLREASEDTRSFQDIVEAYQDRIILVNLFYNK